MNTELTAESSTETGSSPGKRSSPGVRVAGLFTSAVMVLAFYATASMLRSQTAANRSIEAAAANAIARGDCTLRSIEGQKVAFERQDALGILKRQDTLTLRIQNVALNLDPENPGKVKDVTYEIRGAQGDIAMFFPATHRSTACADRFQLHLK